MRFAFPILIALAFVLGCFRNDHWSSALCTDEAKALSKMIDSMGGSCTSRFDVASFCGNIQAVAKSVTNEQERAELADRYCRELLGIDLLGPLGGESPMEIRDRCDVVKKFAYYSPATLEGLGMSRFQLLQFAVAMCTHLREEGERVRKAVAGRENAKPNSPSGGCSVPWSRCPKMVDDVRQQWIWQHIDMPKCRFESIFNTVPPTEKERVLREIEAEIGRKPNLF